MELVPRREDLRIPLGQRLPDYGLALVRAEHGPDRRVLVRGRQLALVVVDVHLHLPEVLVGQFTELQVRKDEGTGEPGGGVAVRKLSLGSSNGLRDACSRINFGDIAVKPIFLKVQLSSGVLQTVFRSRQNG